MIRFLLLASPSYMRPWPTCGILQTPSILWEQQDGKDDKNKHHDEGSSSSQLVLYQIGEGCPESRLIREVLCTLELPYLSIPTGSGGGDGAAQAMVACSEQKRQQRGRGAAMSSEEEKEGTTTKTPVLVDGNTSFHGAIAANEHLWETYWDKEKPLPKWWNGIPTPNLGRRRGSFGLGAYTAFIRGSRSFAPPRAME